MSTEARLKFKLNKKLKVSSGGTNVKSRSIFKSEKVSTDREGTEGEVVQRGKFNAETSDRRKKRIYADQEGTEVEVRGRGRFNAATSDQKKRIYTDQDMGRKGAYTHNEKISSKETRKWNKQDTTEGKGLRKSSHYSVSGFSTARDVNSGNKRSFNRFKDKMEGTQVFNGKGRSRLKERASNLQSSSVNISPPRSMWVSSRIKGATSETKRSFRKSDTLVSKQVTHGKRTMMESSLDVNANGLQKNNVKSKHDKFLDRSQNKNADSIPLKSVKRVVQRKSTSSDSETLDEKPKKRKRIRLDPHDLSNKRMDDDIVTDACTKEKTNDLDRSTEMSKNAQFRAIQPSPSILSFVEDNLLGRRRDIELQRAGYNIDLSAPLDNIPNSTSSERERIEENIFRNKLTFFAAAKVSSSFPPPDLPEIAFAGRSNVGKSSLLNSLTRQWGVVRTSDKPGLTQTINFFNLEKLNLVDLPGYGFAYAKEEVKDAWEELVKEYVSTRVGLKRVCLLIDTKWGMKPRDHELIELMERSQTRYQVVLTKTDTVFPIDVARRAVQIEENLKINKSIVQPVMMVSSKSGAGIRTLRTVLAKVARFAKP